MKVVRVYCEWDFDAARQIYATEELAIKHMDEEMRSNDFYDDDLPDIYSVVHPGYLAFEEFEVVES